ncbi:hypothetical protein HD554DRAFT_2039184 [Boletus coccyginus]|nr:hypothetical protein HD554DRAFT_2039184 [Boletus coccyginus]
MPPNFVLLWIKLGVFMHWSFTSCQVVLGNAAPQQDDGPVVGPPEVDEPGARRINDRARAPVGPSNVVCAMGMSKRVVLGCTKIREIENVLMPESIGDASDRKSLLVHLGSYQTSLHSELDCNDAVEMFVQFERLSKGPLLCLCSHSWHDSYMIMRYDLLIMYVCSRRKVTADLVSIYDSDQPSEIGEWAFCSRCLQNTEHVGYRRSLDNLFSSASSQSNGKPWESSNASSPQWPQTSLTKLNALVLWQFVEAPEHAFNLDIWWCTGGSVGSRRFVRNSDKWSIFNASVVVWLCELDLFITLSDADNYDGNSEPTIAADLGCVGNQAQLMSIPPIFTHTYFGNRTVCGTCRGSPFLFSEAVIRVGSTCFTDIAHPRATAVAVNSIVMELGGVLATCQLLGSLSPAQNYTSATITFITLSIGMVAKPVERRKMTKEGGPDGPGNRTWALGHLSDSTITSSGQIP